jgi:DNA polymerase-3 subunit alpha
MGFATLEDLQGTIELVIFSRVWGEVSPWLELDTIVVVEGRIDSERGEPKVLVDKITTHFNEVKSAEPPTTAENFEHIDPPNVFALPEIKHEVEQSASRPAEMSQEDVVAPAVEIKSAIMPEEIRSVVSATVDEEGLHPVEVLPIPDILRSDPTETQMITINLETTGDQQRDALRMRRVHGLFTSYPGNDRFAFQLFEASRRYLIEFPSHSTGYCADLHAQLVALLGEGAIRVELLRIQ